MSVFGRVFFVTLIFIILFFALFSAFGLINLSVEKSGFSSGEVLFFRLEDEILHTEIFGRRFFVDLGFFGEKLSVLKKSFPFLPPFLQLFIRGVLILPKQLP